MFSCDCGPDPALNKQHQFDAWISFKQGCKRNTCWVGQKMCLWTLKDLACRIQRDWIWFPKVCFFQFVFWSLVNSDWASSTRVCLLIIINDHLRYWPLYESQINSDDTAGKSVRTSWKEIWNTDGKWVLKPSSKTGKTWQIRVRYSWT